MPSGRLFAFVSVPVGPRHSAIGQRRRRSPRATSTPPRLQERQEKKRPLLLDFGTVNCFYCKKLDETTFRDAAVIARLNRDFLPVKIDAARYPTLVQHLNIQFYPTLVVASPAGKILNTQTGFVEASAFLTFLRRSVAAAPVPAVGVPPDRVRPDLDGGRL